jgi:DNA-binding MarR family transcriptional regulator
MNRLEHSMKSKAMHVADECIAVRLRMLSRAVTKLYNVALRPHGLTVSQLNILVAVTAVGPVNQQGICLALCLDKSTLSRDLARMRRQDWIVDTPGEDGRITMLTATPTGKRLLEKAFPAWQKAQLEASNLLGKKEIASIERAAKALRLRDSASTG